MQKLLLVGLALFLGLAFAPQAGAQTNPDPTTLHYVCTGSTVCSTGATTLITNTTLPTFNITIQPGNSGLPASGSGAATLYVIVLVPNGTPGALTFSINGTPAVAAAGSYTAGLLGDHGTGFFAATYTSTANPDFSAYASASGQAGVTASKFAVYVVSFNTTVPGKAAGPNWNATGGTLLTVGSGGITGLSGFPVGTVFLAGLGNGAGVSIFSSTTTVVNTAPLSESLTLVPEPGSMALFGSGLLALGGILRRRWRRAG